MLHRMSMIAAAAVSLLFGSSPLLAREQYVTYDFSGGRLGDCLLTYLHAKWFSYTNQIPLYYQPFEYSWAFKLHELEENSQAVRHISRVPLSKWSLFSKLPWVSCVYKCPYFPESKWELRTHSFPSFKADWKDPAFRKIAQEMLSARAELRLTRPPKDKLSIAMHVREGGGYDINGFAHFPVKFPPLSFYVEGLKAVLERFPKEPIYCYLFTDALDPEGLVLNILKELPDAKNIEFAYRKENNIHDANVLEDFFSLFEFDVLIRPDSNFSIVPSLIHDYKMIYAAEDFDSKTGKIVAYLELNP